MTDQQLYENLMRGHAARIGQQFEVALINVGYNFTVVLILLVAAFLVAVHGDSRQACVFALYLTAGALIFAGKGGKLLHRKWDEFAQAETISESSEETTWKNPSMNVNNRPMVAVLNVAGVFAVVLPILFYAGAGIHDSSMGTLQFVSMTLPPILLMVLGLMAWMSPK